MKLLCLSNGHGEDIIAVRILSELQKLSPSSELVSTPDRWRWPCLSQPRHTPLG